MVGLLMLLGPEDLLAQQGWPVQQLSPYYGSQYQAAPQPGYAPQQNYPRQTGAQTYQQPDYGQQYADVPPSPGDDYGPPQNYGAAPQGQPLDAQQLEQLVAPIALYPDGLVAQVLAAATYPAQVVAADHWVQSMGNAPPEQIAAQANAQNWDPSVKALTAIPQVLGQMDQNLQWTTDLGNAYFNQPQDVLETVQVMRQRAQSAGNLQSTPQESVTNDQGYIQVAPANPQVVYVPAYNPWAAYGQPVSPYPGFSFFGALGSFFSSGGMRWGLGIAMGAFSSTPWGWLAWGLNWLASSVLFQHSNYYSRSTSVAHWGGPRGGGFRDGGYRGYSSRGFAGRGAEGYGRSPQNYGRRAGEYGRTPNQAFARTPERFGENRAYGGYPGNYRQQPGGSYVRPQETYDRFSTPARPQQYAMAPRAGSSMYGREPQSVRPGYGTNYGSGYGSRYGSGYGSSLRGGESFTSRPGGGYGYRPSAPSVSAGNFPRENFGGRSFSAPKQSGSGGFHMFGHSNSSEGFHGGGHAPKGFGGGHSGSGHSGGGHSGGHGGHHH